MISRRSVYEQDGNNNILDSVEVVDKGGVHVVLDAPEGTDKVTLLIGTQRMDTVYVYQKVGGHNIWQSTFWWGHDHETNTPKLIYKNSLGKFNGHT
jgi:hypothetical protein